jgi:hypothetical protein
MFGDPMQTSLDSRYSMDVNLPFTGSSSTSGSASQRMFSSPDMPAAFPSHGQDKSGLHSTMTHMQLDMRGGGSTGGGVVTPSAAGSAAAAAAAAVAAPSAAAGTGGRRGVAAVPSLSTLPPMDATPSGPGSGSFVLPGLGGDGRARTDAPRNGFVRMADLLQPGQTALLGTGSPPLPPAAGADMPTGFPSLSEGELQYLMARFMRYDRPLAAPVTAPLPSARHTFAGAPGSAAAAAAAAAPADSSSGGRGGAGGALSMPPPPPRPRRL